MTVRYNIIEEAWTAYGVDYVSYGIVAYRGSELVAKISDITKDYEKAMRFAALCNSLLLSPIHLSEVVQDFVVE